jgi:DNA invertase Pin-like site-specific DNA recombinase
MTIYGYARVSTSGHSLERQKATFEAAGCAKIFSEKVPGVVTDRGARLPRCLEQGATL